MIQINKPLIYNFWRITLLIMVKVKSFRGYIANPEIASEIASRPYDVITRAQAKKLTDNK